MAVSAIAANALAVSPYIYRVHEYCPAPGQFVGEYPEIMENATEEEVIRACEEQLCGDKTPGLISLGAFGGYVIFSFDHKVVNIPGKHDFKIYGNAFGSFLSDLGGSSEPGIVMVSVDSNGNGLPDDEWFEIPGSEYKSGKSFENFKISYTKPDPSHMADPDPNNLNIIDRKYIGWTSNDPSMSEGWIAKISQHTQSYWPEWQQVEKLEFTGTRLPNNIVNIQDDENPYYVLSYLDYGYADNYPNNDERNEGFDISTAVDKDGNPANLEYIDFVKVYTAMCQTCGMMGETSTEVAGAEDLHPDAQVGVNDVESESSVRSIYTLQGVKVGSDMQKLSKGIYVVHRTDGTTEKVVLK